MELKLVELTSFDEILNTYNIYKHCMYMPTEEKFEKEVKTFISDDSVKIFACLSCGEIKGVIVISFFEPYQIEIIGIAVDISSQGKGIGSYMIKKVLEDHNLTFVLTETDEDTVDFFRKNGFIIVRFPVSSNGKTIIRCKCGLVIK